MTKSFSGVIFSKRVIDNAKAKWVSVSSNNVKSKTSK